MLMLLLSCMPVSEQYERPLLNNLLKKLIKISTLTLLPPKS
jgi:hypothetical protein